MADINVDALQAAMDRFSENFTGLGTSMDAQDRATQESIKTQAKLDRELSKYGLNLKQQNEELEKQKQLQKEVDEAIKNSIPGFDSMTKAQQENELVTKRQTATLTQTLKQLKDQNDSVQGLTREQNAAIESQQRLLKQKQLEADGTKHQGSAITSAFGQISSASGILSAAQRAATEKFGATQAGAMGVNLAFNGLNTALDLGTMAFQQWKDGIDNAFQAQLAYNQQLTLGADGFKLANSQQLARMKLDATQTRAQSDKFQSIGFGLTATAVGLLALRSSSLAATFGMTALGGPVTLVITALTALAAAFGLYQAKQKYDLAQAEEIAAQNLELQNELRDNLFKVFNDIGNMGMTGAGGMTALADEAHRAGFAIKNIDKFAGILKNSQQDMSLFGAGAVEGVSNFATVTGKMSDEFGMHFRRLGIDQEAQAAATEKYMAMQAKLGLSQGKTQEQLASGAAKYLDELDKTANMLGQTRKEQEEARTAIMAIEQLQAAMMEARAKGDKTREAELQRAIIQSSAIQKTDPKVAAGLAKIVSSRGAASDEDTVLALQAIPQTINAVRQGIGNDFSRNRMVTTELVRAYQRTAGQYAATGVDPGMTGGKFGAAGLMEIRNELIKKAAVAEASKKGVKEGTPEFEAILDNMTARQEATDKETAKATQQAEDQQKAAILQDTKLLAGINVFNTGADKFDAAVDRFAKKPESVLEKEAIATQARATSASATEQQALIEDQKKAAKLELDAMYKRGASTEELRKQETKLAEIEKSRIAAELKEMEAGRKAMQAELEAKNERQRINKLQNTIAPASREAASIQKRVDDLKLEKAGFEQSQKTAPGTARDQADRKLQIQGVTADLDKAQKELDLKQKQIADMKKQIASAVTVKPQAASSAPRPVDLAEIKKYVAEGMSQEEAQRKAEKTASQPAPQATNAAAIKSTNAPSPTLNYGASLSSSNEQLRDYGLRLKTGDVQAPGSKVDPKLLDIAKQVQENIPGFMYFSGFNDQFHQENSPNSQHTKGLAFDFTVNPGRGKSKPSKEDSEKIMGMLQGMGLNKVINEYDSPSAKATGGHFHAELAMPGAYDGGVFDGPKSGFPVELHGREAIVPLPDPSSKIKIETNSPDKEPLDSVMSRLDKYNSTPISPDTNNNALNGLMTELIEMMTNKMDDMIGKLDQGNTYSDKLVKAMA